MRTRPPACSLGRTPASMSIGVWVPEDDRVFATRLARYGARNPVALDRRTYDRTAKAMTYRSDKSEGLTAGTETADPFACPTCHGAMRLVAFITQA